MSCYGTRANLHWFFHYTTCILTILTDLLQLSNAFAPHPIPMPKSGAFPRLTAFPWRIPSPLLRWLIWLWNRSRTTSCDTSAIIQSTNLPVLKQKDFVFVQSLHTHHTLHLSSLVNLVLLVHAGFGSRATGTVARPGHLDVLAALIAAVFGRHPGLKQPPGRPTVCPTLEWESRLKHKSTLAHVQTESWFMIMIMVVMMMMMMMTTKMKMMMMNKNLVMGVVDDNYHHDAGENDDDEEDEHTDNDDNDPHDDVDCTEGNHDQDSTLIVPVARTCWYFKSKHHGVGFVHCQFDLWDLPHGGVHMEPHGDFWLPNGPCLLIVLPSILASWHPHCSLLSLRYSQWGSVSPWPGKGWKGKEVFTWGY